jgi:hypothetical protein
MSSLFEELRRKLELESGSTGITAWDLAELPAAQRQIIRLILRDVQMAYPDLRRAIAALPADKRPGLSELDEALARLIEEKWLIRMGQDQLITYRVNLRHKGGSRLGATIWDRLEQRSGDAPAPTTGK